MQGNPYIRIEYLIGTEKLEKIKQAHIAIFGCGGVGSFAIEDLIRSGVKEVTLIDFDTIEDQTVTLRDRDTMEQIRLSVFDLEDYISKKLEF